MTKLTDVPKKQIKMYYDTKVAMHIAYNPMFMRK